MKGKRSKVFASVTKSNEALCYLITENKKLREENSWLRKLLLEGLGLVERIERKLKQLRR